MKYLSKKKKRVVTEYYGLLAIDCAKGEDGKIFKSKRPSQHTKKSLTPDPAVRLKDIIAH